MLHDGYTFGQFPPRPVARRAYLLLPGRAHAAPFFESGAREPVSVTRSDRLVARNFLALGSGEIVARVVGFGATVYIARALGAEAYGVLELAAAIVLYFTRIADAGFDLGLGVREMAAAPGEADELAASALTARTLVSLLCVAILGAVGLWILPAPEGPVLAAYGLTLLAVGVGSRWIHVGRERTRLVAVARTLGEVSMVLLVLALVRAPEHLIRVPFAKLAGDLLAAAILLWSLGRAGLPLRPRLDLERLRPLVRRALPLVLSAFFGLMIYNADLIFIRLFGARADVGHYAAAYTLISFLSNVGIAYALSLLPTLTRLETEPEEQRALYHAAHAHVVAVGLPVAVGGAMLAGPIIAVVFGGEYAAAGPALAVLMWSVPLALLRDLPVMALMSRGRERRILALTGQAAAVNLALNLALVPTLGIVGAAVATVVTEAIRMGLAVAAARPLAFRGPAASRYVRPLLASGVMAAALALLGPRHAPVSVAVGALAYLAALWAVGGIRLEGRVPTLRV